MGMDLACALPVKNLSVINVEFYTGVNGRTLEAVREFCADHVAEARVGRHLREAALDHQARVRVAPHRGPDRLPVVLSAARGRSRHGAPSAVEPEAVEPQAVEPQAAGRPPGDRTYSADRTVDLRDQRL